MSRIVLVTGVAGGLGHGIASLFEAQGDTVIGLDLRKRPGAAYRQYDCDLSDADAVAATMDAIERNTGPVDVLVNNAAYCGSTGFLDLSAVEISRTLAVNVTAVLLLCQHFVRQRRRTGQGGAIVNVASFAGVRGSSQIEYGASKAGVINLTRTMARQVAGDGIRVNAVAPALVNTGMGERLSDSVRDTFINTTPMRRGAEPEEVANVVVFLASDKASYVSGETVEVFGGL